MKKITKATGRLEKPPEQPATRSDIEELLDKAEATGSYLFAISINHPETGQIDHKLVTNNFPRRDIVPSLMHLIERARKELVFGVK